MSRMPDVEPVSVAAYGRIIASFKDGVRIDLEAPPSRRGKAVGDVLATRKASFGSKTSFPSWTEVVLTNEDACCPRKAAFSAIALSEPRVR